MLRELLCLIEKVTGLVMPRMRVPYWLAFIAGAVSELGFPQSSLRKALIDEIEWLLDNGLIVRRLPMLKEV